jgi:hypothetical protein
MAIAINTVIKALLIVGVLVIIVWAAFTLIIPLFTEFVSEELTSQEEQYYQNNFEILIENIEKCKLFENVNCVCEGFPSFPGTFKGNLYLESQAINMELSLKSGTTVYASQKIEDVYITGVLVENSGLNFAKVRNEIDIYSKKWINFDKSPPLFDRENLNYFLGLGLGEPKVIDSRIYKDHEGIIHFLLSYDKTPEIELRLSELEKCSE